MHPNPKRDAQKTEDAGLTAKPLIAPAVTEKNGTGNTGTQTASGANADTSRRRPRQDSLDRERADDEGMLAPPSDR